MASRTRRALFSLTLFLATCAVLGSLISQKVAAQSASDESTLRDSLHEFTNVYSLVEQNYAEPLNEDKVDKAIYDGAIPGMLHVLDPHSNFYDPKAFAQMREDQRGRYYGVGMQIQPQPDKAGIIHATIGRASFEPTALRSNLNALVEALQKAKPATSKGVYLRKVALSSTMGVGVRVDQATIAAQ